MHIQDFFQNFLKLFLVGLHDDCTISLIAQDMSPLCRLQLWHSPSPSWTVWFPCPSLYCLTKQAYQSKQSVWMLDKGSPNKGFLNMVSIAVIKK